MNHLHTKYFIHVITPAGVNTRPLNPVQLDTLLDQGYLHLLDKEARVMTTADQQALSDKASKSVSELTIYKSTHPATPDGMTLVSKKKLQNLINAATAQKKLKVSPNVLKKIKVSAKVRDKITKHFKKAGVDVTPRIYTLDPASGLRLPNPLPKIRKKVVAANLKKKKK